MSPYAIAGIAILIILLGRGVSIVSENASYDHWFKQYAPRGIDWTVLKKIAVIESALGQNSRVKRGLENPSDVEGSKSYDGLSWGLMQMKPSTAKDFDSAATPEKLNNPEYSIQLAGLYLNWARSYLLRNTNLQESDPRFLEFLVKSYNQGVGATVNEIKYQSKNYAGNYWTKFQNA